jgi:hypothetical protein
LGKELRVGGAFTNYFGTWDGEHQLNTPWGINAPVYAMADNILGTDYSSSYSYGVIANNGTSWYPGSVDKNYMPQEVVRNTAVINLGNGVSCYGGTSSRASISKTGLECVTQTLAYKNFRTFMGKDYCANLSNSVSGINALATNETMGVVVAGGCMNYVARYDYGKTYGFNIFYASKDSVSSPGIDSWQAIDAGVNKDVYALAQSGPYEFVGGAFDAKLTRGNLKKGKM